MRLGIAATIVATLLFGCAQTARAQQDIVIAGSVADSTGGFLPGVTVTGTHVDTGNTFVAVTDEQGAYRLPVRVGKISVNAELSGFTTQARTLEMAIGQQAVVNFVMSVAGVQETLTVTSAAPLLDVRQSQLGSNIDTKQMEAIPINGRNWMQLTQLAAGSRSNSAGDAPVEREGNSLQFGLVVDGQWVNSTVTGSTGGEPRFSRDAIGEFQLVTNQ